MYEESIRELAEKLSLRDVAILVTGATGLIGSCIIDVLSIANIELGANIKIYALSRNKEKVEKRFGTNVIPIIQDIVEPLKMENEYDYIEEIKSTGLLIATARDNITIYTGSINEVVSVEHAQLERVDNYIRKAERCSE